MANKKSKEKRLKKKHPITWPYEKWVKDMEDIGGIDLPDED